MSAIYIHIPYCKSKCGYCSFYSITDKSTVELYCAALTKEIATRAKIFTPKKQIDTIYIGGGTPSMLAPAQLARLFKTINECFSISKNAEITVEVNPESCTKEFIEACVRAGVNRISIGLQSHDDAILAQIGRIHRFQDFEKTVDIIEKENIQNISVDAILGLPNQTQESLSETLARITQKKSVKHISLYALTVDENTSFAENSVSVNEDLQAQMYGTSVSFLASESFLRYEVSNFAKSGFESRHNQKYWTHEEYIGFGAGAHSLENNTRIENVSDIHKYINGEFLARKQLLTTADIIQETIMLSLRTAKGLNAAALFKKTGYDIKRSKREEIENLIKNNLLTQRDDYLAVSAEAFYLLNAILIKLI